MFVNKELLDPATCGVSVLDLKKKHGLDAPVSRTAIHTWIKRADCRFDKAKQSYYTNGHYKREVIACRKEYVDEIRRIAFRLPSWVQASASCLTSVELESLRSSRDGWEFYEFVSESGELFGGVSLRQAREEQSFERRTAVLSSMTHARPRERPLGRKGEKHVFDSMRTSARGYPCNFTRDVCKYDNVAYHIGRDEACFKAFLRGGNEGIIRGFR